MLIDDIAAALPGLRAQAESLMTDTCTVTAPGATAPTWDPATGSYSTPAGVTVYVGRCRVQLTRLQESNPQSGETEYSEGALVLSIPLWSAGIAIHSTVTITAVGPLTDAALQGAVMTVEGYGSRKSQPTARRLRCKQVVS